MFCIWRSEGSQSDSFGGDITPGCCNCWTIANISQCLQQFYTLKCNALEERGYESTANYGPSMNELHRAAAHDDHHLHRARKSLRGRKLATLVMEGRTAVWHSAGGTVSCRASGSRYNLSGECKDNLPVAMSISALCDVYRTQDKMDGWRHP